MPNLAPWNIFYPDQTTGLTPLASKFSQLAQTTSDALTLVNSGATRPVPSAAARNTLFPSPVQGNQVLRLDLGYEERYYTAYNASTNPGGATPAGWYPVPGSDIWRWSSRGATDVFTTTAKGNPYGESFVVPNGIYNVDWGISLSTDNAGAGNYWINVNGTDAWSDFWDSPGAGTRQTRNGQIQVQSTTGTLVLTLYLLNLAAGNKTIFDNCYFHIEYVGPTR